MPKDTVFIVPHRLDFCSGFGRTPARARQEIMQTVWQPKSCTVSEIPLGKGGKQTIIADVVSGLDFGKCLTDHVLEKSHGTLVHALMNSFRGYLHLLVQVRHL